jgi:hypothetical protein
MPTQHGETYNELPLLDIETRADEAAVEAAIAAKHDELEAIPGPANYKDAEKIARFRSEKKSALIADLRKEAALSPFTAYVSSIALRLGETARTQVHILVPRVSNPTAEQDEARQVEGDFDLHLYPYGDESERRAMETALLTEFWALFDNARGYTCGFNHLAFDLVFLVKRSMLLNLSRPHTLINWRRYQTAPSRDLFAIINSWTPGKGGLKAVCKALGIENPLPNLNGGDVANLPWHAEARYVANDVALTVALAQRMAGWWWPAASEPEEDEEIAF